MASVDNLFVTVSVFGLAIAFLVILVFWGSVTTDASAIFDATSEGQQIQNNAQGVMDNLDNLFIIVFFAFHLGTLILAFALRTHPIVYVAGILIVAILAIIAAPLSNTYEDVISDPVFASSAATLPNTTFVMANLPSFEVAFGFVTIIILAGLAKLEDII